MRTADEFPDLMNMQQAITFVALHGLEVSPASLRYGAAWPRPQKMNGWNVRWRKDELLSSIQAMKENAA